MGYVYAFFLLCNFTVHSNVLPIITAFFVWRRYCESSLLCDNQGFWVTCNLHMLSLRLGLICLFFWQRYPHNKCSVSLGVQLLDALLTGHAVGLISKTMTELSLVNRTPTYFHKFSNFLFYISVSDLNLVVVRASSKYLILLWVWPNPWEESSSRAEGRFWLMIIRISFHSSVTFEPVTWRYILALGVCDRQGYPLMAVCRDIWVL